MSVALSQPEALNLRLVARAKIGLLLFALCAVAIVWAKGDVRHVSYQHQVVFAVVLRALMIAAVLVLASREALRAMLGMLDVKTMVAIGALFGAATALVSVCLRARFPLAFDGFQVTPLAVISVALFAISVSLILFGWLQTRLGQILPPAIAALVVSGVFIGAQFLQTRSWLVAASNAGYYSLPFLRWKTGSLGACAVAIFSAEILLWMVFYKQ